MKEDYFIKQCSMQVQKRLLEPDPQVQNLPKRDLSVSKFYNNFLIHYLAKGPPGRTRSPVAEVIRPGPSFKDKTHPEQFLLHYTIKIQLIINKTKIQSLSQNQFLS